MQRSASNAQAAVEHGSEQESVVVHVQLRPRRGATRKCLTALAALAAEHDEVSFAVTGLSKDDRVVRVTVGVDLGPRTGVAKFSPQAQAAYAFVSAALHRPVRPHAGLHRRAQRRRARRRRRPARAGRERCQRRGRPRGHPRAGAGSPIPAPRMPGPGERIPA